MCALLLLLIFFIGDSIARDVEFCYVNEDDPYLYMGAKTAYTFVGGSASQFSQIPNCVPMQFWMIAKHDACYPSMEKIEKLLHLAKIRDQIIMNHEISHNGHMCDEDLDNLRSWSPDPDMKVSNEKEMTTRSIDDVRLFARRIQSYYPELVGPHHSQDITSDNYVVRSSGSKAARKAMESFMEGFFNSKYTIHDSMSSAVLRPGEDSLMKEYSNCSRASEHEEFILQNAFMERDEFLNSTDFTNVIKNVSRRTGFKYQLSPASILMMYDMCRLDKAWTPSRLSPWCAVFTKQDLKIIEYAEDIMYYYGSGYGRKDKTTLGCIALEDMVQHFKNLETHDNNGNNNNIKPKGIFYFTNTMIMLNFLTTLNIGNDEEMLMASNYKNMARRQWRTSLLAPFNSNLIAVFYRCQDTESPNKVMFYLQEKPLMLEGCQVGLCDWEYLKNKFQRILDNCNPRHCNARSPSTSNYQAINILLIINILIILTW